LQETPARYLKFLNEFCNPPEFKFTTFDSDGYDQMIVQTNIPFFSLCEHHMVPFYGHASVAYIPSERIVGLSKLARTVEWYSRRLQNQERITKQVADKLTDELKPLGVAVLVTARHLCMEMRGVRKHDTHTTTSMVTGVFADDPSAKAEFMEIVKCR
ncbi:MAG: GTP cyclohydrolase I, partial [Methylophilus sp.]|jgi:GTP cyclohydrolase I